MYLIAGLGNPGITRRKNRHNVGFMLVDQIARDNGISFQKFSANAKIAKVVLAGQNTYLLKSRNYMNNSGRAVQELVQYFDFDLSRCLIAYDEIALPLGRIRFRPGGSSGGHNGMRSVIQHLGTDSVPRLRIGILGQSKPQNLADYVLRNFKRSERKVLSFVLDLSVQGVVHFVSAGIENAMSRFNPETPVSD